jgi:hypothetical protein
MEIGEIVRTERDLDRLHVQALKLLLDAGFPTSIIRSIDAVFFSSISVRARMLARTTRALRSKSPRTD